MLTSETHNTLHNDAFERGIILTICYTNELIHFLVLCRFSVATPSGEPWNDTYKMASVIFRNSVRIGRISREIITSRTNQVTCSSIFMRECEYGQNTSSVGPMLTPLNFDKSYKLRVGP